MKKNYHIIKNIVSKELCEFLTNYSFVRRKALLEIRKENLLSHFDYKFGSFGDTQFSEPIYCIYGQFKDQFYQLYVDDDLLQMLYPKKHEPYLKPKLRLQNEQE